MRVGGRDARLDIGHRFALRLGDAQLLHDLFKGVAVFRARGWLSTSVPMILHAHRVQAVRQVDGRLPAQAHDHAFRLFQRQDVHHVFHGQRLEIQLVRGGVIGGYGFRVVVDDDGLVPRLPDGPDGVHGGVIKLHALPDADGAGAQHHDLLFVRIRCFRSRLRRWSRNRARSLSNSLAQVSIILYTGSRFSRLRKRKISFSVCPHTWPMYLSLMPRCLAARSTSGSSLPLMSCTSK